jgi:capsular exopolysaccharide synthesis family protein
VSRIYDALKRAERRDAEAEPRPSGEAPRGASPLGETACNLDPPASVDRDARLQYERLQMWLTSCAPDASPLHTVLIASCQGKNGATTAATGLATTLARGRAGSVLIVDANVRTPSLHTVFGVRAQPGLAQLLGNGTSPADYAQPTAHPNLSVITSGVTAASVPEVVAAVAFGRLVKHLKSQFDYIVVDAAPFLDFPDAYGLAPHVDAVVVVVEADRTLVEDARRVMRDLERSRVRAAGVILNRQRDYTPRLLRRMLSRVNGTQVTPS